MSNYLLFWFLLGVTFLLPFGINNRRVTAQQTPDATVEGVIENTDRWLGQTVTVKGTIEQVEESSAFTIEDERYFGTERVLVINQSGEPIPELPEENTPIQVTGTVAVVDTATIAKIEGLEPSYDSREILRNRTAIYADSLVLAPDPGEITTNPTNYYGRPVAVEGKVEEVLGSNAFTLAEYELMGGQDLLVVNMTDELMPTEGATVLIKGQVRPFDRSELEVEYGENWDREFVIEQLDPDNQGAVLIVDSIAPAELDVGEPEVDTTPY